MEASVGQSNYSALGQDAARVRRVLPLQKKMDENLGRLSSLAASLGRLSNQLVGPRPSPVSEAKEAPPAANAGNLESTFSASNQLFSSLLADCERHIHSIEEFI